MTMHRSGRNILYFNVVLIACSDAAGMRGVGCETPGDEVPCPYVVLIKKEKSMPHPVDVHVGKQIRHRRWLIGVTQQQLAEAVGIKFQQIQKYETGANRVSASRLWDIAEALEVEIAFFFDGLDKEEGGGKTLPADIIADKEALDLVRSYYAIPENQRRRLFDLARVLSEVA